MKHTIRLVAASCLVVLSCHLFSFVIAPRLAEGIWQQLGITQQDGNDKIKKSFLDGYLHYEGLKAAKNIGDRGRTAADLLAYTRQYLSGPVFKAAYDKMRKDSKPSEPVDYTRPKEQIRQDKIADTKKLISNTENVISTGNAEIKKTMQPILEMHRKNLADYQNPNSQTIELLYQSQVDRRKKELEDYKKYTLQWAQEFPEDSRTFIKRRIQKYLSLAATVDFSATTHEKNGKQIFDKQEFQYKSNDWKMIYRAGKEVYDVTRTFTEKWIQELP
ncbi:MAG: hypothetical protein JST42_12670 [Bacteroidetes bacterium]|nr:hypothetical protein [Bacteroidota bacterium]